MKTPTEHELALIIESATRKAVAELFSKGERFYYFALITTGEALPPYNIRMVT